MNSLITNNNSEITRLKLLNRQHDELRQKCIKYLDLANLKDVEDDAQVNDDINLIST